MTNEQLVIQIQAGIDTADNMLQLWQQNQGYIAKIAMRFQGYEDLEDLKQQGYLGLYDAVDGYNPDEGTPFINYAAFWIRQSMQRYIENCGAVVRVPTHTRARIGKYKKFCSSFAKSQGREPTDREISLFMGISHKEVEQLKKDVEMARIGSTDSLIKGAEGDLTVGDMVASSENVEDDVLDAVQEQQLKEVLWPVVDALGTDQAAVVRYRFKDELTLNETGAAMGVTKEKARQLQAKALRELRRSWRLAPYGDIYSRGIKGCGVSRFNETWTSSTEYTALGLME